MFFTCTKNDTVISFIFLKQQNPAYLRVFNNSKLKYSARVNYDVACPMHFEEYPMDTQRCNISFESWGHPCQVNYDTKRKLDLIASLLFSNLIENIFIFDFIKLFSI